MTGARQGCKTATTMLTTLKALRLPRRRAFATVSSSIISQPPHPPPVPKPREDYFSDVPPLIDARVLQAAAKPHKAAIGDILKQYLSTAATVLDVVLPYEATPTEDRRPRITDAAASCRNVVAVAHCVRDGLDHKVTLASGFALNVRENGEGAHETLIVTCAHSLEEVSFPPSLPRALWAC